jgi:phospholipid-binding lipoprotein MlaA
MPRHILLILAALLLTVNPLASTGQETSGEDAVSSSEDDPFADESWDDTWDDEFAEPELVVYDPLEKINRGIFWFNDKVYFYALKPVARVFRKVPEPVRVSIANFFSNLTAPIRFASSLAQAEINKAGTEMSRFFINTTVGIGGLFDPARKYAGLREQDEDFGQTLGVYGFGPGPYLVIPFLGPSNVRDGIGDLLDYPFNPLSHLETEEYWGARAVDTINFTSLDKDTYESIKQQALDPYLFLRDAYLQNRAGKIGK